MFKRHVVRTFARQWISVILLSFLLIISGFIYTIMAVSVRTLKDESEAYFETTNQEDFSVHLMRYVTDDDQAFDVACDFEVGMLLSTLKENDETCHQVLLDARLAALSEAEFSRDLEYRVHKDGYLDYGNTRHRTRVFRDNERINTSRIETGSYPESGEVAIGRLYAELNDLTLDDDIELDGQVYRISGYVLLPDYNLPIFEHMYMFDSAYQTIALVSHEDFDALSWQENRVLSGIVDETMDEDVLEETVMRFGFVERFVLTEHNLRSGAIYAELDGGQATGLFLSIMLAVIGLVIVGIMVSKTMSEERRTLGVFKALGVTRHEMVVPYLIGIALFSMISLFVGYVLGLLAAPWMQDLYLRFYLLPRGTINIQWVDLAVAVFVPTVIVVCLTAFNLYRMVKPPAVELIEPQVMKQKPRRIKWLKKLLKPFDLLQVLQGSMLIRQWGKVLIYVIGIFLALYMVFLSLGMRNLFQHTMQGYYGMHTYESVVYCEVPTQCDAAEHDKGIEIQVLVQGERSTLLALDPDNNTHPLPDLNNGDLRGKLSEGLIISRSFKDLTGLDVGDRVDIMAYGYTFTETIVGITDLYPGAYIFYDREAVSLMITQEVDYFNRLYTEERMETSGGMIVHRETMLEQVESIEGIYQTMIYLMVGGSFAMAVIVIYLLMLLTVESKYYEMSLFKVLGYTNKEISKVLLGGYFKLNVVIFISSIPLAIYSFGVLTRTMLDWFGFFFPLRMEHWDIVLAFVVFGLVAYVGSLHARHKIKKRSLQEALKIYQV